MLCLMWDCEDRGFLRSDDKPWPIEDVAGAVGGPIEVAVAGITELLAKGVARRESNTPDGAIYSARMVREHTQLRQGADRQNRYRKRDVTQVSRGGDGEVTPEKPEARSQKPEDSKLTTIARGEIVSIPIETIRRAATIDDDPVWQRLEAGLPVGLSSSDRINYVRARERYDRMDWVTIHGERVNPQTLFDRVAMATVANPGFKYDSMKGFFTYVTSWFTACTNAGQWPEETERSRSVRGQAGPTVDNSEGSVERAFARIEREKAEKVTRNGVRK